MAAGLCAAGLCASGLGLAQGAGELVEQAAAGRPGARALAARKAAEQSAEPRKAAGTALPLPCHVGELAEKAARATLLGPARQDGGEDLGNIGHLASPAHPRGGQGQARRPSKTENCDRFVSSPPQGLRARAALASAVMRAKSPLATASAGATQEPPTAPTFSSAR